MFSYGRMNEHKIFKGFQLASNGFHYFKLFVFRMQFLRSLFSFFRDHLLPSRIKDWSYVLVKYIILA